MDFHTIARLQQAGDWAEAGHVLARAARTLEAEGADGLAFCTNTMHQVAPAIEAAVTIPLLHMADPTAAAVKEAGLWMVGLLGARFTLLSPNHPLTGRGRRGKHHCARPG